jgi:hypothetical protein
MEHTQAQEEVRRVRDAVRERMERIRFELLARLCLLAESDCGNEAAGPMLAAAELSTEELFRAVEYLAHHGYVEYLGVGPRVRLTARGLRYLRTEAGKRRSIR